ncbi:cysteine-rich protein 2-like protein [Dinothrombium tinctorium]|uniref:Cysteine-rich protein 2-like protein n=1 Tax=Dinothrombium tinctorium TaxID=1965070 RepID=A0A443RLL7_9ACAR|nr:cysteine-rich protein 2-like protein [Dinothrombium tinctorium]
MDAKNEKAKEAEMKSIEVAKSPKEKVKSPKKKDSSKFKSDVPSASVGQMWTETETPKRTERNKEAKEAEKSSPEERRAKSEGKKLKGEKLEKVKTKDTSPKENEMKTVDERKLSDQKTEESMKTNAKVDKEVDSKKFEKMKITEMRPASPKIISNASTRPTIARGDSITRPVISPKCYSCIKNISEDQFVLSTEQVFHFNCFRCAICSQKLKPGNHVLYDRYVFCKEDCVPASEKEEAPSESGENLGMPLELSIHKGHPVSQKCFRCEMPVRGTDYVISKNRVWHRFCFRCNLCKRFLTPADHMMRGKDSFCRYPCYERKFVKPFTGI